MHPSEDASDLTDTLPEHMLESILARLPIPGIVTTRLVCKRFLSLSTSPTFRNVHATLESQSRSWLYVNGFRYQITDAGTANPTTPLLPPTPKPDGALHGAGGLEYTLTAPDDSSSLQRIRYKLSFLDPEWLTTPALPDAAHVGPAPIVAAIPNLSHGAHKLVVAGSGPKATLAAVSVFDSRSRVWTSCEPLPAEFQGLSTSRSVTAVVCARRLYLFHIYSGMVASLDVVGTGRWSAVTTLRPPGAQYCYLAARCERLLLVGVRHETGRFSFRGWEVDAEAVECRGPSWPVVCHFASVKASVANNGADALNQWSRGEASQPESCAAQQAASGLHSWYLAAVLKLLARPILFRARVVEFVGALREFTKGVR